MVKFPTAALTLLLLVGAAAQSLEAQSCEFGGSGFARFDVSPRTGPDGLVDVSDLVLTLRFAVGLEAATAAELRRADVAPCGDAGDGVIDVADVVRALRWTVGFREDCTGLPRAVYFGAEPPCRREGSLVTLVGFDLVVDGQPPRVVINGAEATVRSFVDEAIYDCCGRFADAVLLELGFSVAPHPQDITPNVEVTTNRGTRAQYFPFLLEDDCSAAPIAERVLVRIGLGGEGKRLVVVGEHLSCVSELRLDGQVTASRLVLEINETQDSHDFERHLISADWPEFPSEDVWDLTVTTDCGQALITAALDSRAGTPPQGPSIEDFDRMVNDSFRWTDRLGTVDMLGAGLQAIDRVSWSGADLDPAAFRASSDGSRLTITVPPPPVFPGDTLAVEVRFFADGVEATGVWGVLPRTFRYLAPCDANCGSLSPAIGPSSGGARVLVTAPWGSRLSAVDGVTFGGFPGTDLELLNDQQLFVTTPPGAVGEVAVVLESAGAPDARCETLFEYR